MRFSLSTLVVSGFFVLLTTAIMTYISLAVAVGPWIEPTLALLGVALFARLLNSKRLGATVTLATIGGGLAGIIASACAWTVPALYFLDKAWFGTWFAVPTHFAALVGAIVFVSGALGLVLVNYYENRMLADTTMAFPIAQLVHKSIAVQDEVKKGYQLLAGVLTSLGFHVIQTSTKIVPTKLVVLVKRAIGYFSVPSLVLRLDLVPMLWAIGFTTGHVIAVPLAAGALIKVFLVDPLHSFAFAALKADDFLLAICSGIVVYGALMSCLGLPKACWKAVRKFFAEQPWKNQTEKVRKVELQWFSWLFVLVLSYLLMAYFKLSLAAQLFAVGGTLLCAYQLIIFMAKTGLAPLGRFATWVMLPGLAIFGFTYTQAILVAALVEITGGVAADAMSGRKLGALAELDRVSVRRIQWFALCVTALSIGFMMWFLINHFGLGSTELGAQKAASRALLLNAYEFNIWALCVGIAIGVLLKVTRINASLVLGGLLMSLDYSLILIASGLCASLIKNKEDYYPFWSGIFAASSIWMLVKATV